jgi:lycopene cyclase domain-containing protein
MIEQAAYLLALLVSIAGLAVLDHRFRLAIFYDAARTIKTILAGLAVFILWDILGIRLGIFFTGDSKHLTGLQFGPEFPVEELFFLILLIYTTLLVMRGGDRLWPRT